MNTKRNSVIALVCRKIHLRLLMTFLVSIGLSGCFSNGGGGGSTKQSSSSGSDTDTAQINDQRIQSQRATLPQGTSQQTNYNGTSTAINPIFSPTPSSQPSLLDPKLFFDSAVTSTLWTYFRCSFSIGNYNSSTVLFGNGKLCSASMQDQGGNVAGCGGEDLDRGPRSRITTSSFSFRGLDTFPPSLPDNQHYNTVLGNHSLICKGSLFRSNNINDPSAKIASSNKSFQAIYRMPAPQPTVYLKSGPVCITLQNGKEVCNILVAWRAVGEQNGAPAYTIPDLVESGLGHPAESVARVVSQIMIVEGTSLTGQPITRTYDAILQSDGVTYQVSVALPNQWRKRAVSYRLKTLGILPSAGSEMSPCGESNAGPLCPQEPGSRIYTTESRMVSGSFTIPVLDTP